jgi:hypothetical protein
MSRCWRISAVFTRAGRQGSERSRAGGGPGRVRRERARPGGRGGGVAVPELAVADADVGVLATVLRTPDDEVDEYLRALAEMAEASGGGITL